MSDEENVYEKKTRNDLVDNDEISAEEEGFMQGYDKEEKKKKKKKLPEPEKDEIDKLDEL